MKDDPGMVFLNPNIGPEPVTGSTRMKGATATKMILEVLFAQSLLAATEKLGKQPHPALTMMRSDVNASDTGAPFSRFAHTRSELTILSDGLVPALEKAGNALNSRGHIYYVGEGTAGIWGIIEKARAKR